MEMTEKIKRIVGANLVPAVKLSDEELKSYEDRYLEEALRVCKKIESREGFLLSEQDVVLEKMMQPFEYWLREQLYIKNYKEKHPEEAPI